MSVPQRLIDLLAPALVLLVFLVPLADGFTDDGYIHIQYARNIVAHGEYSFNPGEVSFGTSSPLWVMALATVGAVAGGEEALVVASRVFSWACGFATLIGIYALALAIGARRMTAVVAAVAFAADVWFARWTALSMESSAGALAVVLMALASVRAFDDTRSALRMGAAIAIASLVRPEVYVALPVVLVAAVSQWRTVNRRSVVWVLLVALALLLPWLLFARFHIGSFLPNTAGAKSGGLILSPLLFLEKLRPVVKVVGSSEALPVVAMVVSLLLLRGRSLLLAVRQRFMLLYVVAVPVAYVVLDIQILSRYLLLITPVVCVLGWVALQELLDRFSPPSRHRAVMIAAVVVAVGMSAGFYWRVVVPPSRAFTYDLTHGMKGLARFLDANAAEDAVVAAADIGYLAYYGKRRVLDLGGLVEPETGLLRSQYSYEQIAAEGLFFDVKGYPRVDYFVDRDLERDRLDGRTLSGHRYDKVYETTVRNLGIRKPGPYYYVLYKLTPTDN